MRSVRHSKVLNESSNSIRTHSGRIKGQNLVALKSTVNARTNAIALIKRLFCATLSETLIFVSELAKLNAYKPESCNYNGHALKNDFRRGMRPLCSECGGEITSLHQIRKESVATVTSETNFTRGLNMPITISVHLAQMT